MKKLLYAALSICIIAMASCEKMERDFIVTGTMVYADNKEQVKGKTYYLVVIEKRGSFPNRKEIFVKYAYTTDSSGAFQVRCRAQHKEIWYITLVNANSILHHGGSFSKKDTDVDAGIIEVKR